MHGTSRVPHIYTCLNQITSRNISRDFLDSKHLIEIRTVIPENCDQFQALFESLSTSKHLPHQVRDEIEIKVSALIVVLR